MAPDDVRLMQLQDAQGRQRQGLRLLGRALVSMTEAKALPASTPRDVFDAIDQLEGELVEEIHRLSAPIDEAP